MSITTIEKPKRKRYANWWESPKNKKILEEAEKLGIRSTFCRLGELNLSEVLPKGTTLIWPFVWGGILNSNRITKPKDVKITLEEPTQLGAAIKLLEDTAHNHVINKGGTGLRDYFIEDVTRKGNTVGITWGT